jgi:acetyltransferase (GNAT) family protein
MDVRRATPLDMDGILQLQAASFIGNLSAEDREDGFLSMEFTLQQFDSMARDCALIVAVEHDQVVGYLCSASVDYCGQFPLLAALLQRFPDLRYAEQPLDSYRTFVYGPVCIARSQRGRGLLRALYQELLRAISSRYDLGVALISKDNPRSFEAHVRKLGMTPVGDYEFRRQQYDIVAFHIPNHRDQANPPDSISF